MSKTGLLVESDSEQSSNSSDNKVLTRKNRPVYTQTLSVKRYHKIPLRTQQTLFEQVFKKGRKIKQVAKELRMNYSSAKSLIHYYKKQKRPAPEQVKKIIGKKKEASYRSIEGNKYDDLKLKVYIKLKHVLITSYDYFRKLEKIAPQSQC